MKILRSIFSCIFYAAFLLIIAVAALMEFSPAIYVPESTKLLFCVVSFSFLIAGTYLKTKNIENYEKKTAAVKVTIWAMFLVYLAYLVFLLFIDKNYGRTEGVFQSHVDFFGYFKMKTNFIPFKTISNYLKYGEAYYSIINIGGNLAAFVPFGIFLPLLFKGYRKYLPFILTVASITVLVEFMQLLLMKGSCDIDDVILNVLGAIIALKIMRSDSAQRFFAKFYTNPQ